MGLRNYKEQIKFLNGHCENFAVFAPHQIFSGLCGWGKIRRTFKIMKILWISFPLLLFLTLGSCGQSQSPLATPLSVAPTKGEPAQKPSSFPTTSTSGLEDSIEKAMEALAQRLSVPVSEINLAEAEAVTWSDGSLGCPQPGKVYAEVLMPGYLIKLTYAEHDFEYHAGRNRLFTYCENPISPVEGRPDNT